MRDDGHMQGGGCHDRRRRNHTGRRRDSTDGHRERPSSRAFAIRRENGGRACAHQNCGGNHTAKIFLRHRDSSFFWLVITNLSLYKKAVCGSKQHSLITGLKLCGIENGGETLHVITV